MKLSYMDILGDRERHEVNAIVTTDHSASSYGQPVIVLESDGEALDITSWILLNYQIVEATPKEIELLKRVLIVDPRFAAAALGRKGGSATSSAKQAASRANGKLGGRPRKSAVPSV
jgi:hypothetical protein